LGISQQLLKKLDLFANAHAILRHHG
jgi:hypothetical protein